MPNLNEQYVTSWLAEWRGSPAADWPPPIRAIEQQDGLPELLEALGAAFDGTDGSRTGAVCKRLQTEKQANNLRSVLAQLGAARALRILQWLSELDLPESRALLDAMLRDRSSEGIALCALVDALRRRATLDRIFAPDRLTALERACTETLKEDA